MVSFFNLLYQGKIMGQNTPRLQGSFYFIYCCCAVICPDVEIAVFKLSIWHPSQEQNTNFNNYQNYRNFAKSINSDEGRTDKMIVVKDPGHWDHTSVSCLSTQHGRNTKQHSLVLSFTTYNLDRHNHKAVNVYNYNKKVSKITSQP